MSVPLSHFAELFLRANTTGVCSRERYMHSRALVSSLQDWKDHQHICCQSSGGVAVHEDESITSMDMDKVK